MITLNCPDQRAAEQRRGAFHEALAVLEQEERHREHRDQLHDRAEDADGHRLQRARRVLPAGPPAAVLLAAIAPAQMLGFPEAPGEPARRSSWPDDNAVRKERRIRIPAASTVPARAICRSSYLALRGRPRFRKRWKPPGYRAWLRGLRLPQRLMRRS